MDRSKVSWSTNNEKTFIDGLVKDEFMIQPSRLTLNERILNYIKGAKYRAKHETFCQVDANKVIAYAEGFLE